MFLFLFIWQCLLSDSNFENLTSIHSTTSLLTPRRFTVGQFSSFRRHLATELLSKAQKLEKRPYDKQPIIDYLVSFPSEIGLLADKGQEEADFARQDVSSCFRRQCIALASQVREIRESLKANDWSPFTAAKMLIEISLHIGRLSIDYDHSNDVYVTEVERIIEAIDLNYRNAYDDLSTEEAACKFVWDGLNCPSTRCACLQCLTRYRRRGTGL